MASPLPPVEAEIARLHREGFEVEAQVEDQVTLVKRRTWREHWLGALLGALGGTNPSPRTQRVYLWVDGDGGARIRLAPRATNPPDHLIS
jgi:hypothetical protein